MAELDKISFDDIFDENPFDIARKSLDDLIDRYDDLIKNNTQVAKGFERIANIDIKSFKDLKDIDKALDAVKSLAKEQQKNLKIRNELTAKSNDLDKIRNDLNKIELTTLNKQSQELQKQSKISKDRLSIDKVLKENIKQNARAYIELSKQLDTSVKLQKELKDTAATLSIAGNNDDKVKDLNTQINKLEQNIVQTKVAMQSIDTAIGKFTRKAAVLKETISDAFKDSKNEIDNNLKSLVSTDERLQTVTDSVTKLGSAFNDAAQGIKNGSRALTVFINLIKSLTTGGLLGLALLGLQSLASVANSLGGVFNKLKDIGAGTFQGLTTFFATFSISSAIEAGKIKANVNKLEREFELLQNAFSNLEGNLQSDSESIQQILDNTFESDAVRFKAAVDFYDNINLQLNKKLILQQKELDKAKQLLDIELINNRLLPEQLKLVNDILQGKVSTFDAFDKFKDLPNGVQKALQQVEQIVGNIEVTAEQQARNNFERSKYFLEQSFERLLFTANVQIRKLKTDLDTQFNTLDETISFNDTRNAVNQIIEDLRNGYIIKLQPIIKLFGKDVSILNTVFSDTVETADDVRNILTNQGLGEDAIKEILDLWEDFNGEYGKYKNILTSINKEEQQANIEAQKRINAAKRLNDIAELQQDIEQQNIRLQQAQIQGVDIYAEEEYKLREQLYERLFNLQLEQLKQEKNEILANKRLTDKERAAIELEYQNKENEIRAKYTNEQQQRSIENLKRIKEFELQTINLISERKINELNELIERNQSSFILNYSKLRDIYKELNKEKQKQLDLELQEQLRLAQTQQERAAIMDTYIQKYKDLNIELQKQLKELNRNVLNEMLSFVEQIISKSQDLISQKFQKTISDIDANISTLQNIAEKEQQLAEQGVQNNLNAIERQIVELEAKKRDTAKKEQAIQLALSFLNAYASYAKEDAKTALPKATRDVFVAKALSELIAGAFAEGVEGFQGKGTETSDSNLVLISKGESVITAEATKKYKGLATAMNDGKVEQWFETRYVNNAVNIQVDSMYNLINEQVSQAGKKVYKALRRKVSI